MIAEYNKKYRDECVELFVDNYTGSPFNYGWMRPSKITQYFIDMENSPQFFGFIILENDQIAGVCLGVINDYFEIASYEIKEIVVRRELQGKGVGSAALTAIEGILRNAGIDAVTLNTNTDIRALDFYKKNGYEIAPKAVMLIKSL